jgi:hypothetical protein
MIDEKIKQEFLKIHEKQLKNELELEWALFKLSETLPKSKRIKFYYAPVKEDEVCEHILAAATRVLEYCKTKLKIRDLEIHWLRRVHKWSEATETFDRPVYGAANQGHIVKVREDVPILDIKETIAHEAHHIWFTENLAGKYPYDKETEMWETTANTFAQICLIDLTEQDREAQKGWPFES